MRKLQRQNGPNNEESAEDLKKYEKLEKEEQSLLQQIKEAEEKGRQLKKELTDAEVELGEVEKKENECYLQRNEYEMKLRSSMDDLGRAKSMYQSNMDQLDTLRKANVFTDTFDITFDGPVGRINELRLGIADDKSISWNEINAALGHIVLLLSVCIRILNISIPEYILVPMGSTSRIERIEKDKNDPDKKLKKVFDLYSVGEFSLGRIFTHNKLDAGMMALLDGKTKTAAQSELLYVTDDVVMVLPRDSGLGRGQEDGTESVYRHVDLYSLKDATNILGKYDGEGDQIASSKGKLVSGITAATHYEWIDINDNTQLNKYGVHNGGDNNSTLLNEKWEGLTLIPIPCTTDEYFLLAVSDNDFTTTNGWMNFGTIPFDSGDDFENQSLMWRVKLAAIPHNEGSCFSTLSSNSSTLATSTSSTYANSTAVTASLFNSTVNTTNINTKTFSNSTSSFTHTLSSTTQTSFENSTTSYHNGSTNALKTVTCTLEKCSDTYSASDIDQTATTVEIITSCKGGCSKKSQETSTAETAIHTSTSAVVNIYEGHAASTSFSAMTAYALAIAVMGYLL